MKPIILAACAALAVSPALADTVATSAPFSVQANGTYNGDFVAFPPAFDPALGTLTGETLTIAGTFTPGHEWQSTGGGYSPSSVPVTLTGHIGIDGYLPETVLAAENVSAARVGSGPYTWTAIGTPEAFSVSAAGPGTIYPDVLAWTQAAAVGYAPTWTGVSDLLYVAGTATAVYDYTPADPLPEPGTLALLGSGLVGFLAFSSRSRCRSRSE